VADDGELSQLHSGLSRDDSRTQSTGSELASCG
jgi:hypothetical protein